jgi:hypothetical protein
MIIYIEASIAAFKQDFDTAIGKHLDLQKNTDIEEYYRLSSQIDLAELQLRLNQTSEGINGFKEVLEKTATSGFKYLEMRSLKRLKELNAISSEPTLINNLEHLIEHHPKIGSDYVDSLEFMLPM